MKAFALAGVAAAAALAVLGTQGDAAIDLDDPGLWIGLGVALVLSLVKLVGAVRERMRQV